MRLAHYGEEHPRVADMYFNIGGTYLAMKVVEKAHEYIDKSLQIRISLFGKDHFAVALCLMNIGRSFMLEGKLKKGSSHMQEAKELFSKHFGIDHPHVQGCDQIIKSYDHFREENPYVIDEEDFEEMTPVVVNQEETQLNKLNIISYSDEHKPKSSCCTLL